MLQVYELHRLYRIQKIMMRNIESHRLNAQTQELWSSKNGSNFNQANYTRDIQQQAMLKLDLERPATENVAESNGGRLLDLIDESEIELTLGPTSYNRKKKPETPLASDSCPSFSSCSTGSSHINRTSFLTHQMRNTTREELSGCELGLVGQIPDMSLGYQNAIKNSIDVEEQMRQERLQQPPWLFQVLSMNMA